MEQLLATLAAVRSGGEAVEGALDVFDGQRPQPLRAHFGDNAVGIQR